MLRKSWKSPVRRSGRAANRKKFRLVFRHCESQRNKSSDEKRLPPLQMEKQFDARRKSHPIVGSVEENRGNFLSVRG